MNFKREMIRINMEKRKQRQRAENWSEDERNLLRNLVAERIDIVESKNSDNATNLHKLEVWKEIWERFIILNQRPRSVQKLREQWKRIKIIEKAKRKKGGSDNGETSNPQIEEGEISVEFQPQENGGHRVSMAEYKLAREPLLDPPKPKNLTTHVFRSSRGIEYKRSMLELNKLVKEQITNCALEEHHLKMEQLKEEHALNMERAREMHQLQAENERLKNELMRLDIEIKKKQLQHGYVI